MTNTFNTEHLQRLSLIGLTEIPPQVSETVTKITQLFSAAACAYCAEAYNPDRTMEKFTEILTTIGVEYMKILTDVTYDTREYGTIAHYIQHLSDNTSRFIHTDKFPDFIISAIEVFQSIKHIACDAVILPLL